MKQGQRLQVDRKLRGDITAVIIYIKGCRKKKGSNLFSTSRVDKIKITGLSYKKPLCFTRKKEDNNLLAVEHWTLQQAEAVVSFPTFRTDTSSEEWLWHIWFCLGTERCLHASVLAVLPLLRIAAVGCRMRNPKSFHGPQYFSFLYFTEKSMADNGVISIVLILECRKRMIIMERYWNLRKVESLPPLQLPHYTIAASGKADMYTHCRKSCGLKMDIWLTVNETDSNIFNTIQEI